MLTEVDSRDVRSQGSSPPSTRSRGSTTEEAQLSLPSSHSDGEDASGSSPSKNSCGQAHRFVTLAQLRCALCFDTFTTPKVLSCLHTYCEMCLKRQRSGNTIRCPECNHVTSLPPTGTAGLPCDYAVTNILQAVATETSSYECASCTRRDATAIGRCFHCTKFFCGDCAFAHRSMHPVEDHMVLPLKELQGAPDSLQAPKELLVAKCLRHNTEALVYYCLSCNQPVCKECLLDHPTATHNLEDLSAVGPRIVDDLSHLVENGHSRSCELKAELETFDELTRELQAQYQLARGKVTDTYNYFRFTLEKHRQETMRKLEDAFTTEMASLARQEQKVKANIHRIRHLCAFGERLTRHCTSTEALVFKQSVETKFQELMLQPGLGLHGTHLEFVSNHEAIQKSVQNAFGYIKQRGVYEGAFRRPFIARPYGVADGPSDYRPTPHESGHHQPAFPTPLSNETCPATPPLNAPSETSSKYVTSTSVGLNPLTSKIVRQKIEYQCKFGAKEGWYIEPSGVAVNAQNYIVIADKSNHRIQIFDCEGRFKFKFGKRGKIDGQMLYPNRVAVVPQSGDIVVTERSPTHQIQIYNQYGRFLRKFGDAILQFPRAIAVDHKGRVVVVECKLMRVTIFNLSGAVLRKFDCSNHLQFPNGVVVNDNEEIFISDNHAHCVHVFSYEGMFLRKIGGAGLTNYPIGVCLNRQGKIFVADNNNHLNVTVFTEDGQLVNTLQSKKKHAPCFDVTLTNDGSLVLASMDGNLYIYRNVSS